MLLFPQSASHSKSISAHQVIAQPKSTDNDSEEISQAPSPLSNIASSNFSSAQSHESNETQCCETNALQDTCEMERPRKRSKATENSALSVVGEKQPNGNSTREKTLFDTNEETAFMMATIEDKENQLCAENGSRKVDVRRNRDDALASPLREQTLSLSIDEEEKRSTPQIFLTPPRSACKPLNMLAPVLGDSFAHPSPNDPGVFNLFTSTPHHSIESLNLENSKERGDVPPALLQSSRLQNENDSALNIVSQPTAYSAVTSEELPSLFPHSREFSSLPPPSLEHSWSENCEISMLKDAAPS